MLELLESIQHLAEVGHGGTSCNLGEKGMKACGRQLDVLVHIMQVTKLPVKLHDGQKEQ